MTLLSCQSITSGPKAGSSMIFLWRRGELLENKKAANIIKGVVGIIGRMTPIKPRTKLRHPNVIRSGFVKFFTIIYSLSLEIFSSDFTSA